MANEAKELVKHVRDAEIWAQKSLDQLSKQRRDTISQINLEILTQLRPNAENLKRDIDYMIQREEGLEEQLAQLVNLKENLSDLVRMEHIKALEMVDIEVQPNVKKSSLFNLRTIIDPNDIRLWYHPTNSRNDRLQVKFLYIRDILELIVGG